MNNIVIVFPRWIYLPLCIFIFLAAGCKETPQPTSPTISTSTPSENLVESPPSILPAPQDTTVSLYEKDTDADGAVDFIEQATGYNHLQNDCLMNVGCGNIPGVNKPEQQVNMLIMLDASGSMGTTIDGKVKMEVAKQAITNFVNKIPPNSNVGLLVYGHTGNNTQSGKAASCTGAEILVPLQTINPHIILEKVASFNPTGWTPIAASLQLAKTTFAGKEEQINRIILVSDGEETCGGEPCSIAKELQEGGINVVIDVVGFDVDEKTKTQLECIATVTHGEYVDTKTAEQLLEFFNQKGQQTQHYAQAVGCLGINYIDYLDCENKKLEKILIFINEESAEARAQGDMEKAKLLSKLLTEYNKKRVETTQNKLEETLQEGERFKKTVEAAN